MGTLTLADFESEVRFDLKNRPDTSSSGLTQTRINTYINAAYRHVAHPSIYRHRGMMHTFTIPLVSGTNQYTFSPNAGVDIVGIRSVTHIDDTTLNVTATKTKLKAKDAQWFDERTLSSGSRPSSYAVEGNAILIEPVPDTAQAGQLLFFRTWRYPALLSAAGDVTTIDQIWDEVIILGARWRAEKHLGYHDLAEATKLDFGNMLNEYANFEKVGSEDWDYAVAIRQESSMESA